MTLCLQIYNSTQAYEMSEYVSVTQQAHYTHVTSALYVKRAIDACLEHVTEASVNVRPKALGNQNVRVSNLRWTRP